MSASVVVAAGSLVALAVLHSLLGERLLIAPLLALDPWPKLPLGRTLARRTLRFAWHLTSVAWLGLAALLAGAPEAPYVARVVTAVLAVSGATVFAATRGRHFAWVVFLTGAIAGAVHLGLATPPARTAIAWAAGAAFAGIAALHVAWAFGLRWAMGAVLPSVDGRPAFTPPRVAALAVAGALVFAAWLALGLGGALPPPPLARELATAGAIVLGARVFGDLFTMGLFKRVHGTTFARWDDVLFTPVCFLLGACLLLLGPRV